MASLLKKFGVLGGFALGLIGFILVSVTDGVTNNLGYGVTMNVATKHILFGADNSKVVVVELIGWILAIVALILLLAIVIGQFANVAAINKLAGLIGLGAGCLLAIAGVIALFVVPAYMGTYNIDGKGFGIGAGWVFGGLLMVCGGGLAVLPKFVK